MKHFFTLITVGFLVSSAAAQIDWVGLRTPATATNTMTVYAEVWKNGVTVGPGQGAGISCQVICVPVPAFHAPWLGSDPWGGTTIQATYIGDSPNFANDRYEASVSNLPIGLYEFKMRCIDASNQWRWDDGFVNGQFTVNTAPLPVNLITFRGKRAGNTVQLLWSTALEVNHDRFVVERADETMTWVEIGMVRGKGQSAQRITNYTFTDDHPLSKQGFYRLRIVATDGSAEFSSVFAIGNERSNGVKIYPNPASDLIFVDAEAVSQVTLFNSLGQRALNLTGLNSQTIDISGLESGLYVLIAQNDAGETIATEKIYKN